MNKKNHREDVFWRLEEAEILEGRKGWFSDNPTELMYNEERSVLDYGEMQSWNDAYPFLKKTGRAYRFFLPEEPVSYSGLQKAWVERNCLKAGDTVVIRRTWSRDQGHFTYDAATQGIMKGELLTVKSIDDDSINLIRKSPEEDITLFVPYFCIAIVQDDIMWNRGDFFRSPGGELWKVSEVEDNRISGISSSGNTARFSSRLCRRIRFDEFNLDQKEDRNMLRGRTVYSRDGEAEITLTEFIKDGFRWRTHGYTGEDLRKNFLFEDGSPVGREVEDL